MPLARSIQDHLVTMAKLTPSKGPYSFTHHGDLLCTAERMSLTIYDRDAMKWHLHSSSHDGSFLLHNVYSVGRTILCLDLCFHVKENLNPRQIEERMGLNTRRKLMGNIHPWFTLMTSLSGGWSAQCKSLFAGGWQWLYFVPCFHHLETQQKMKSTILGRNYL